MEARLRLDVRQVLSWYISQRELQVGSFGVLQGRGLKEWGFGTEGAMANTRESWGVLS